MMVGQAATSRGSEHVAGMGTPRAGSGTCSVKRGSSEPQPKVRRDVSGIATVSPRSFVAAISTLQVPGAQLAV
jgi:hypothetical protein